MSLHIAYDKKIDKISRYCESNLPCWFKSLTETEIPKIIQQKNKPILSGNILALVHHTSELRKNLTATQVVSINELEDVCVENDFLETKLIKIKLQSVKEAKNRAIALALLTADVRESSEKFIRFFTKTDF